MDKGKKGSYQRSHRKDGIRIYGWHETFFRLHSLASQLQHFLRSKHSVRDRCSLKIWGVPRGGAIVAGLLVARYAGFLEIVSEIDMFASKDFDVIVDDLKDTGETMSRESERYGKDFFVLVDKEKEDIHSWVVFPWETMKENSD